MKIVESLKFGTVRGFKFGFSWYGQPSLFSHVYYLDGLLIDTGHRNMGKVVLDCFENIEIDQIMITHHHEDHTGNLDFFQQKYNCPSFASAQCVELMQNPPTVSFAQKMTWGDRPANFQLQSIKEKIRTERYEFDIIPIPGHAIDMVALHEPNQGWLFSADLWVYDYIRYFMREESMKEQINSLKRVLPLDFDVLYCGHNPIVKNVKQRLKNKIDFFEEFYEKVSDAYEQGMSAPQIMRHIDLKEKWSIRLLSSGALSAMNMVKSVIRDLESSS